MKPKLIAIVGGSGAGKSWLAIKLQQALGENSTRLTLDDFYHDRSHLPAKQRGAINFDHPRAIDWKIFEYVLGKFARGRAARAPRYDFATHSRIARREFVQPKPLIIVDGLWLLRRPAVRKLFSYRIFIKCSPRLRLHRRLSRDLAERGRDSTNIRKQFLEQVIPMHERFVSPQMGRANIVLTNPRESEVTHLAEKIKTQLNLN